ncbi:MAG TPA: hypothetical protein VHR41_03290 [Gemmatimonadales bacterium]|jgi:hypothetical protein|nr:hypothetical protein [Gemmatimonadales bacterium]
MARHEVRFEALIGCPVTGAGGAFARIEDVRVEPDGEAYLVRSFILGPLGAWATLSAFFWQLPTLRALGLGRKSRIRVVPWELIDLSDPEHPKLLEREGPTAS